MQNEGIVIVTGGSSADLAGRPICSLVWEVARWLGPQC
jgi:hypothetical protein